MRWEGHVAMMNYMNAAIVFREQSPYRPGITTMAPMRFSSQRIA